MALTSDELENRIRKNFKKLKPWAQREGLEAYRVYDRDLPNFPFAVDLYGSYLVIQDRRQEIDFEGEDKLAQLKEILTAEFRPKDILVKVRRPQREGGDKSRQYEKASATGHGLWVREGKARFLVNLYDYLDTGLFLDHRRIRHRIFKELEMGDDFLNLFSYTGTASVWAALAGAQTRSVDLSNTYMAWAQSNFKGNDIPVEAHEFVIEDSLKYLSGRVDKKFDVIFLDPPTFSNSKSLRRDFDVDRDHQELLNLTLCWLKPGGRLIFSCNKRDFKLADEVKNQLSVQDISRETLPLDFRDAKIRQAFLIKFSSTSD
jgi:23S rRNA (cytosine1962-C5)-methyltransferase/23S rRNA (guanine2445-N2)-methyltransferase / 23S rRNA (guanine2069-N7)-methyltransferase